MTHLCRTCEPCWKDLQNKCGLEGSVRALCPCGKGLENALGSAYPLFPTKAVLGKGVTLTGTILKGYSQSGGQEPP